MIISRTPFRISFFGGGTDYPLWYLKNGGAVLSTTIDKYCYISCRYLPPFFQHRHRIVYSKVECVNDSANIDHPSVRATMREFGIEKGIELHHDGDLPARSGLGSSSAFTVGLINVFKALEGKLVSKEELASQALHIEQDVIKETVGSQDQIATAYGGFNKIEFYQNGLYSVRPLICQPERRKELEKNLVLVFTGFSRFASEVAKTKIKNLEERTYELNAMRNMVDEAITICQSQVSSMDEFGRLMDEAWKLKRSLSTVVSTPEIDEIYAEAMAAGALGGKLLGAGGGGFMLFYVRPESRRQLQERLYKLIQVKFEFESEGSKIVVYSPSM